MGDLGSDLRIKGSDGRYRGEVSPDWVVWTPNGGFLAGLALNAAGAHGALRIPAGLSCHYLNVPAVEAVDIEVTTLRASSRAESMRVSMRQGKRPILEALIWLTAEQEDALEHESGEMPDVPPPEQVWPWTAGIDEPQPNGIRLWQNIEARMHGWPQGQAWEERKPGAPVRNDWCRFRPRATFDDPFVDATRSLILIDTFMFPAAMLAYAEPVTHIAPSLDLSVWFHRPVMDEDWLLIEASSPIARAGLVGGSARVWTQDGRLVASGGQQMLGRSIASLSPPSEMAPAPVGSA